METEAQVGLKGRYAEIVCGEQAELQAAFLKAVQGSESYPVTQFVT